MFLLVSAERERRGGSSFHQTQTAGESQDGVAQQADNGAERTSRISGESKSLPTSYSWDISYFNLFLPSFFLKQITNIGQYF